MVCREDKLVRLTGGAGDPAPGYDPCRPADARRTNVKGYSHKLGECGTNFFCRTATWRHSSAQKWPHVLDVAPLLIPGKEAAVRTPLMRWLDVRQLRPRIVGEFDDSALMQAFGQAGNGIFIAPSVIADEVQREHGVVVIGADG